MVGGELGNVPCVEGEEGLGFDSKVCIEDMG